MSERHALPEHIFEKFLEQLALVNCQAYAREQIGGGWLRQPIHTVYGGAHLYKADTVRKLGLLAGKSMDEYGRNFVEFAVALKLPGHEVLSHLDPPPANLIADLERQPDGLAREKPEVWLAHEVYQRVRRKLASEPVEDYRIDFEDGYGSRPDSVEDADAEQSAAAVAVSMSQSGLPAFWGIRIKSFSEQCKRRSLRTLDRFFARLLKETGGQLPGNCLVTLPKVADPAQVSVLAAALAHIEGEYKLPTGAIGLEIMVELPENFLNSAGLCLLPELVRAAQGRCAAVHFGAYDFLSSLQISSQEQSLDHPACDSARLIMKLALASSGVRLSDGAITLLPVAAHRPVDGARLSDSQLAENRRVVHQAWCLAYRQITRALQQGYYQGWDLHPAQLPVRYAASYAFFLASISSESARLKAFLASGARANRVGAVFDDAATGQRRLLNFFLQALQCGALDAEEFTRLTGLSASQAATRSFVRIASRSDPPKSAEVKRSVLLTSLVRTNRRARARPISV